MYTNSIQQSAHKMLMYEAALSVDGVCHMPMAFVLINAELGEDEQVRQELLQLPNVIEASLVYGTYDIIVKVEAESMTALKELITTNIRRINKVKSTLTMIVTEH